MGPTTLLTEQFKSTFSPRAPYNFELTVKTPAGWDLFTPYEIYEDRTIWTGLHIDGLLVGVRLKSEGTTRLPIVSGTMFLARKVGWEPSKLKVVLAEKLGINDDLSEFYKFARRDFILKNVVEDLYGMRDTFGGSLFDRAILAICLQMARIDRSNQMMESLVTKYGEVAEFDGRRVPVWPTPTALSKATAEELQRECKLGYRAKYVVQIAKILNKGNFPSLEDLALMQPEKSKEKLLELPGIGDYSADIINPRAGFPIDAWSVDVFGKLFFGREPRNRREAIERVKKEGLRRWGKWSWLAFFYVAQDLKKLSRRLDVKLRLQ